MKTRKPALLFAVLFFVLCFSDRTHAFYDRRFSLGAVTGFGVGAGNCPVATCDIPNISNQRYHFIPVMVVGAYRFSEAHSLRVGLGFDKYVLNSPYGNSAKMFFSGEAYYTYHFMNERQIFAPYALAGARFPTANIALGIGNELSLNESFSILTEILASTFFSLDQRFEARIGAVAHF